VEGRNFSVKFVMEEAKSCWFGCIVCD